MSPFHSGVRRGGLGGSNHPLNVHYFFHKFQVIVITFNIEENQENALLQLNMQFSSSWNDCRRQLNCRHHVVINDISLSTRNTKLNKLAISFGRPGPKKAPASGWFAPWHPDQALCPWTPLGALPDPRYMLALRACHVTPKPNSCIHQCNPFHCEILFTPMPFQSNLTGFKPFVINLDRCGISPKHTCFAEI